MSRALSAFRLLHRNNPQISKTYEYIELSW
jgi:hypothetical protein